MENQTQAAIHTTIHIDLPLWLSDMLADLSADLSTDLSTEALPSGANEQPSCHIYPNSEARMALVIQLARYNIEHATGGPFAAAIFDRDSQRLIAAGVNVVIASQCSMAHAEMLAISMAQQQAGHYDLAATGRRFELVTSCEPCAMCFGAVPWSGIQHLVCGARDADARAIGFDEGPKIQAWQQALEQRGITVETDVCRQQCINVLQHYAATAGHIYNAGAAKI